MLYRTIRAGDVLYIGEVRIEVRASDHGRALLLAIDNPDPEGVRIGPEGRGVANAPRRPHTDRTDGG